MSNFLFLNPKWAFRISCELFPPSWRQRVTVLGWVFKCPLLLFVFGSRFILKPQVSNLTWYIHDLDSHETMGVCCYYSFNFWDKVIGITVSLRLTINSFYSRSRISTVLRFSSDTCGCCHGSFHFFSLEDPSRWKQNCKNYGKPLVCSMDFLSRRKLETKLFLHFLSSNCCQGERLCTDHWVKQGLLFPLPCTEQ